MASFSSSLLPADICKTKHLAWISLWKHVWFLTICFDATWHVPPSSLNKAYAFRTRWNRSCAPRTEKQNQSSISGKTSWKTSRFQIPQTNMTISVGQALMKSFSKVWTVSRPRHLENQMYLDVQVALLVDKQDGSHQWWRRDPWPVYHNQWFDPHIPHHSHLQPQRMPWTTKVSLEIFQSFFQACRQYRTWMLNRPLAHLFWTWMQYINKRRKLSKGPATQFLSYLSLCFLHVRYRFWLGRFCWLWTSGDRHCSSNQDCTTNCSHRKRCSRKRTTFYLPTSILTSKNVFVFVCVPDLMLLSSRSPLMLGMVQA